MSAKGLTSKIRVTFYAENYLIGGSERYLIELMNRLDPALHELQLVYAHNPAFDTFIKANLRAQAQLHPLPIRSLTRSHTVQQAIKTEHTTLLQWSAYPRALIRYANFMANRQILAQFLKTHPADVLHINNGGYPGGHSCRAAIFAAADAQIPVRLMAIHNIAYDYTPIIAVEKWLDRYIQQLTHQFITQSHAAQSALMTRRGFQADKISNIYFGVDHLPLPSTETITAKKQELNIPPNVPIVGMVALFEPRKGYQILLQALPIILKAVPNAHFVLVGSGPFFETIQTQAAPFGDRVIFTGHRSDFREIMTTFDVLLLPSLEFESVPYVILEAMAMGKPVIGSTDGGIPEAVVDGETGLLVPPGAVEALGQAIIKILTNTTLAHQMGQNALARSQAIFNMDVMVAQIQTMYQHYLGQ